MQIVYWVDIMELNKDNNEIVDTNSFPREKN